MGDLDDPGWSALADAPALDEHDSPAEVDAAFRTQRRIALAYGGLFLLATLGVPLLTLALDWWSDGRVLGGMSPNFVMAAGGLYVVFFLLAVAAATLANSVEDRMLGRAGSVGVDREDGLR